MLCPVTKISKSAMAIAAAALMTQARLNNWYSSCRTLFWRTSINPY